MFLEDKSSVILCQHFISAAISPRFPNTRRLNLQHSQEEKPMSIITVTDATFEADVLQSAKPVLVDFWAEWCAPCKMIAPVLEEVSKTYDERVIVAKIDIDKNPLTAPKYGVRGIPTLMLFKDGSLVAQKVGALSKSQLEAFLNESV